MEPIELEFTVACSPEHAFDLWAGRTSVWWPTGHSVSGEPGLTVTFEPYRGGRIFERTPQGVEHDWGEVLAWERPERLRYLWHLRQDRADATEVEISFTAGRDATTVRIVHLGWERLGAKGPDLLARNRRGWAGLLPHYEQALERLQEGGTLAEGTREQPWVLKTPSGQSEFTAFRDEALDPPALVVQVGKTELRYHLRCLDDLRGMLETHGDWMPLGSADEQKPAAEGTVEAWARSPDNPVGGWYGLKKGLRGRFANYVPPVLEVLGRAEVEHAAGNNRMRAS